MYSSETSKGFRSSSANTMNLQTSSLKTHPTHHHKIENIPSSFSSSTNDTVGSLFKDKEHSSGINLDEYCDGIGLALELAVAVLSPQYCKFDSNGQIIDVVTHPYRSRSEYLYDDNTDNDDEDEEVNTIVGLNMSGVIWERVLSDCCGIPPFSLLENTFPTDIIGRPVGAIYPKQFANKFKVLYLSAFSIYSGVSNSNQIELLFSNLIDEKELVNINPNITNLKRSVQQLCRDMFQKIKFQMNEQSLTRQGNTIQKFSKLDEERNCTFKPKRSNHCIDQSKKVLMIIIHLLITCIRVSDLQI